MNKPVRSILLMVGLMIIFAGLVLLPGQFRAKRAAAVSNAWYLLKVAETDLEQNGGFTNPFPNECRIYEYTNRYSVSGSNYQCVLAADRWDYQGKTNLLTLTSDGGFLYIGKNGVARPRTWKQVPGY